MTIEILDAPLARVHRIFCDIDLVVTVGSCASVAPRSASIHAVRRVTDLLAARAFEEAVVKVFEMRVRHNANETHGQQAPWAIWAAHR